MSDDSQPKPQSENLRIFEQFMKKKGLDTPACPVCKTNEWGVSLVQAATGLDITAMRPTNAQLPCLVITCSNCYYVMQFAWLPIMREASNAG